MRAAPLVAAILAAPTIGSAEGYSGGLLLHVRVEDSYNQVFRGWVDVPETVQFVAHNSGKQYTIHGHSPLGALLSASRRGGFEVLVSDEFLGMDFSVEAVAGDWGGGPRWWDYRINYVATYYGSHYQWLAFGPELRSGDEVLWYLEGVGVPVLRLRVQPAGPSSAGGCAYAFLVEERFPDIQHQAGNPWPPVLWKPTTAAQLRGIPGMYPVVGGFTLAAAPPGGVQVWADTLALPAGVVLDVIRSDRAFLTCG